VPRLGRGTWHGGPVLNAVVGWALGDVHRGSSPRAVELLAQEGIDGTQLVAQCCVPADLFRTVTSRTPDSDSPESAEGPNTAERPGGRVVSLLERQRLTPREFPGGRP